MINRLVKIFMIYILFISTELMAQKWNSKEYKSFEISGQMWNMYVGCEKSNGCYGGMNGIQSLMKSLGYHKNKQIRLTEPRGKPMFILQFYYNYTSKSLVKLWIEHAEDNSNSAEQVLIETDSDFKVSFTDELANKWRFTFVPPNHCYLTPNDDDCKAKNTILK